MLRTRMGTPATRCTGNGWKRDALFWPPAALSRLFDQVRSCATTCGPPLSCIEGATTAAGLLVVVVAAWRSTPTVGCCCWVAVAWTVTPWWWLGFTMLTPCCLPPSPRATVVTTASLLKRSCCGAPTTGRWRTWSRTSSETVAVVAVVCSIPVAAAPPLVVVVVVRWWWVLLATAAASDWVREPVPANWGCGAWRSGLTLTTDNGPASAADGPPLLCVSVVWGAAPLVVAADALLLAVVRRAWGAGRGGGRPVFTRVVGGVAVGPRGGVAVVAPPPRWWALSRRRRECHSRCNSPAPSFPFSPATVLGRRGVGGACCAPRAGGRRARAGAAYGGGGCWQQPYALLPPARVRRPGVVGRGGLHHPYPGCTATAPSIPPFAPALDSAYQAELVSPAPSRDPHHPPHFLAPRHRTPGKGRFLGNVDEIGIWYVVTYWNNAKLQTGGREEISILDRLNGTRRKDQDAGLCSFTSISMDV